MQLAFAIELAPQLALQLPFALKSELALGYHSSSTTVRVSEFEHSSISTATSGRRKLENYQFRSKNKMNFIDL